MTMQSRKRFDHEAAAEVIRKTCERWPSSFVARSQIPKFTGGLIAVGTIANQDSAGTGPAGAFRLGRTVCYPVESLVEWLIAKLEG